MELKAVWKAYDNKLNKLMELNLQTFKQLQVQKAKSKVEGLTPKIIGLILGQVWVLFLGSFAFLALSKMQLFFAVSVGAIMLITIIAMIAYIRDIALIYQLNNDEDITATQKKLAMLQSSAINTVRISVLQLPFYTTFFITMHILSNGSVPFLLFLAFLIGMFTFMAIWLYSNINYKNIDKKWLRTLLKGSGWESTVKAMEFLNQVDEFKKEA